MISSPRVELYTAPFCVNSDRFPYQADSLTGELEAMLAQGWTRADA